VKANLFKKNEIRHKTLIMKGLKKLLRFSAKKKLPSRIEDFEKEL
jgi:hypothetical protein